MAAETKLIRKMEKRFKTDHEYPLGKEGEHVASEEDDSPGGKLRRRTVMRQEKTQVHSESEQSDSSWGEIRRNLPRERVPRPDREENRKVTKRDSLESTRSSRKRTASYNSAASRESGQSIRRFADLFQPVNARYKNSHIRVLPPCLRQTFPRATDPPLSLRYYPTILPDATKQRNDMDKVTDVILSLQGQKSGNIEADHSKLAGKTISALRGFGGFQVRWGIWAYGKELNAHLRRMSAYEKEEIQAEGVRRLISNRAACGISTLKIWTFRHGEEDNKTATLADFAPSTVEEIEKHYLAIADMGPDGRYPFSLDFTMRSIRNKNLARSMIFGAEHYSERGEAL